jgi:hypothetical protein
MSTENLTLTGWEKPWIPRVVKRIMITRILKVDKLDLINKKSTGLFPEITG